MFRTLKSDRTAYSGAPFPTRAATIALGLLMAAWIPAGAAYGSCELLKNRVYDYVRGSSNVDPTQPKNVQVSSPHTGTSFTVSWDIPSTRPAGTIAGHCVDFTHEASGENEEYCRSSSSTSFAGWTCITGHHCTGILNIKVRLTNNCDVPEAYSASVSHEVPG